jgi:hypothetical protein
MGKPNTKLNWQHSLGDCDVKKVLHEVLERSGDPSRLLELYYWTAEPDVPPFVRQFMALSESARLTLATFMSMTKADPKSVRVTIGPNGEVIMASAAVTEVTMLKKMATQPNRESPESLH